MTLTITLEPEMETRFRAEAAEAGLTPEELASRRLLEVELLWRIRTAAPEAETRELHKLLRRRCIGTLSHDETTRLQALLDEREESAARRMEDLAQLSRLRGLPVRQLADKLDVSPRFTL